MENKRIVKSYGEYFGCEELDLVERLDYHYFNLKEVVDILSIPRDIVKKYINPTDVRIDNGKTYIDSLDLRKLIILSGSDKVKKYINDIVIRDEYHHWFGACVDDYIVKNESIQDISKYRVASAKYNYIDNLIYGKGENNVTEDTDPMLYLIDDISLDQSLDKIYDLLTESNL